MANKSKQTEAGAEEDDILAGFSADPSEAGLDGAIDDLRGVLQNDADGTLPDLGEAGGFDFDAAASAPSMDSDLSQFGGGDFGSSFDAGGFGGGAVGGGMSSHSVSAGSALHANLDLIMDIPIDVQIVLGNSHMHVATLMNLTEGATIALDRRIGEPVEVIVNGRMIGRGEITVLEEDNTRFGVRMIEVKAVKK
mgnify:CR=1 FL=1